MTKFDSTVSGNITNKISYSDLQDRHLDHDKPKHDKNKFIYTDTSKEMRKYNFNVDYADENGDNFEEAFTKRFKGTVEKHNAREHHKNRRYKSVLDYGLFNTRGERRMSRRYVNKLTHEVIEPQPVFPEQSYLLKLGNQALMLGRDPKTGVAYEEVDPKHDGWLNESLKTLMATGLTQDEAMGKVQKALADGFQKYNRDFNKTYSGIMHIYHSAYHSDEEGFTPHTHNKIGVFVETGVKRKKISWSFPKALDKATKDGILPEVYEDKDPTKKLKGYARQLAIMKNFRDKEDHRLIDCVNEELSKQVPTVQRFNLVRTHATETGLKHEDYKRKENEKRLKAQDTAIAENYQKLTSANLQTASQKKILADQQKQTKESKKQLDENNKKIAEQKKTLAENQSKLDDLDNYQSLIATYKSTVANAKQQQKEAEAKRSKALQEKAYAEKARDEANKQAQLANQNLINQLNSQKKKQDAKEKALEARERDLNAKELGGTDSQGNHLKGFIQRENELDEREQTVTQKENDLQNYNEKIAEKKKILSSYSSTLEQRKQKIYAKQNADFHKTYADRKAKYDKDLQALKDSHKTSSKVLIFASYVYHSCAETFISTVDPNTNSTYNNGSHTLAHDLAHGIYKSDYEDAFSNKSSLECCLIEAKGNKKNLWKAVKVTGKKFLSLINTDKAKSLAKTLDAVDESGLTDETIKQANSETIQRENKRQAVLQQQKQARIDRIKNIKIHVEPRSHERNPYDD